MSGLMAEIGKDPSEQSSSTSHASYSFQDSHLKNLSDRLFKEFTDILVKHNVTANQANWLTMTFNTQWHYLPIRDLEPLQELLRKLPISRYLEKETEIKKLFHQVHQDLRLLVGQDVCEVPQTE